MQTEGTGVPPPLLEWGLDNGFECIARDAANPIEGISENTVDGSYICLTN